MNKTIYNLSFVSASQLINLIVPIILFPYLVKILGVEIFGKWSLILSITSFFQIITNYDFRSTHTRALIENVNVKINQVSIIVSSIIVKLFLIITSIFILTLLNIFWLKFSYDTILLVGILVLANGFDCFWMYQASEKLFLHSSITSFSKILILVLVFLLVKNKYDLNFVIFSFGITSLVANLLLNIIQLYQYKCEYQNLRIIYKNSLSYLYNKGDGFLMFSNLGIATYTNLKGLIISTFVNDYQFGIFSIIEKILYFLQLIPISPIVQVIYPSLVKKSIENKILFYSHIKKYQTYTTLFFVIYCSLFFLTKDFVLDFFFHIRLNSVENWCYVILMLNALITNSTSFLIQYLLVEQHLKDYFVNHFFPSIVGLFIIVSFTFWWGIIGGSLGVLLTTCIIVLYTHYLFYIKYENTTYRLGV